MPLYTFLPCTFLQFALPISVTTLAEKHNKGGMARSYTRLIAWKGDRELEDTLDSTDLLQWWQQQRITSLRQEADVIRNSVLQEVFSIRRRLALCSAQQTEKRQDHLTCDPHAMELDLERIHDSLNQLSERLDPPYIQESLPLAIGYAADRWKVSLPLTLCLPQLWPSEPTIHAHLLITFLNALCKTLSTPSDPKSATLLSCNVSLQCASDSKHLMATLSYRNPVPAELMTQLMTQLAPIVKTFQMLSKGDFTTSLAANNATLKLSWCNS